jgi:hypothetical protein
MLKGKKIWNHRKTFQDDVAEFRTLPPLESSVAKLVEGPSNEDAMNVNWDGITPEKIYRTMSGFGVCEGNNLAAAGCPNIDTLGPCGGGLHSDQEFALIPSFAERAKLSLLLLTGVNSGRFDVASLRP